MAKIKFNYPENFLQNVINLGNKIDKVADEALHAGAEIILDEIKKNLESAIGHGENSKSTGELVKSLGITTTKMNKYANYNVKVGFKEPRSDGGINAKIANILEYGRSNQPARPWLAPAKKSKAAASRKKIKEVLVKYIEEKTQ